MSLTSIKRDIYQHIAAYPGLPAIVYPNVDSSALGSHLRVFVSTADTVTHGLNDLQQEMGLIYVNVFVRDGAGDIAACQIADLVVAAFPRNLELNNLRIDKVGSIGNGASFEGWYMLPVKIPYQSLS